ncbi:unnamed protein product [Rotaria sp. Silwood1]|nr:unnamed protein product [Rotaria sp. Silwood1]
MSGEKKRYRWRHRPILIEESLTINSTSTTITTKNQEEKHTENIQCKWYNKNKNNDDDDDNNNNNNENIQLKTSLPNETISEKIDRILKKINAWTNDTSIQTKPNTTNNISIQQKIPFNKTIPTTTLSSSSSSSSKYDNIHRKLKPTSTTLLNTVRQRCSSSTYEDSPIIKLEKLSNPRPYSMTFTHEPLLINITHNQNPLYEKSNIILPTYYQQNSIDPNQYTYKRRSICSQNTNLTSLSSTYGSDFFYPFTSDQEQHNYDNLNFIENNSSHQYYEPFPTVLIDCQRCSQSVDRSLLRDISCQVPSDEESLEDDIQLENRKTRRSSPVYISPRSSPTLCHPPMANSLLAPYHLRRKHSLSSYVDIHNRSKSVPSSSSTITTTTTTTTASSSSTTTSPKIYSILSRFSPLPITSDSNSLPSTTTLLRSIKTSINAMKKRLKDIRRLSEDSNVTTVLDDYTARSSQELTVSKGQHVRIVQKQLSNAPDWCLIRLLNEHNQQQNQSTSSSLAASSTTITSGSADLSLTPFTKHIEGLVPTVILKSTRSSSSNIQLPPPLSNLLKSSKSEQDGISDDIDESQQRNFSLAFQFSKRKSSLRRILRNPVRRLSLKDTSTSKDVKTPDSQDLIATSTTTISTNSGNDISVNKRQQLSANSSGSRKVKAFTFINTDDMTSYPDNTNSINKSIGNGDVNDIYKMTESSSSSPSTIMTIISPRNNLENNIIEIPSSSSFDIQSQRTISSNDTNIDFSPAVIVRKLVNTLALESSRSHSRDLSSRLRKTRVPPLTSISPIDDDSVIARLVQHVAPINVVSGLTASDFQIPAALSITTPTVDDISTNSLPSSLSSTITVIQNDSQSEQTDEISLNDTDQTTLSSLTTTDEPMDARTKYGAKRRHNIIELIETEKEYVKDLALIVEGYMNVIENDKDLKKPTGLTGRERVVFGNVQRIYEFHRDTFLPQLEQCIENPNTLGRLFTTNRFNPYVRYCENKPRSEYIVSEYHDYFEEIRKKLGQKLLVSDLLIKPVQRIMRYQLLLKEILKSTERMGDESRAIRSALQVMIEVPQQANDMMNVGRIKDLPTNVHQLGELKLQDMLSVSDPISSKDSKDIEKKLKERRVFLFQQSMIFCDEIPAKDKYSSPNYIYKYELKINKLQHKEFKRNKELFQFTLVEVDAGNTRRVICQCKDDEQYELWVTSVNKVLQRQMDLIIALTNPTAALQKEQDSSMLLFTPSYRNQIKKTISNQMDKSLTSSKYSNVSNLNRTKENRNKRSSLSFFLFDSIFSNSVTKSLTTNTKYEQSSKRSYSSLYPQSSLISNIQLSEQTYSSYNNNNNNNVIKEDEYVQLLNTNKDNN